MIDLDKLESLARAATPGPWRAEHLTVVEGAGPDECGDWWIVSETKIHVPKHSGDGDEGPQEVAHIYAKYVCTEGWPGLVADAEFIAAANPAAILDLIRLARRGAVL